MNTKRMTPSVKLYEDLKGQIFRKELKPHELILSGTALSTQYGMSYPTVHRVLTKLSEEGVIYRIHGKGTFVAEPAEDRVHPIQRLVGILLRTEGHVWSDLYQSLVRNLQQHEFWPVTQDIDNPSFLKNPDYSFRQMLSMKPIAIIAETTPENVDVLKKHLGEFGRLILVKHDSGIRGLASDFFVTDFEAGGYLLCKHLLEKGHTRLVMQGSGHLEPTDPEVYILQQRQQGVLRALDEAGLDASHLQVIKGEESDDFIRKLFSRKTQTPTAVMALSDFKAKLLMDVFQQMGARVPQDIAVTGYFNTPWAEQTLPQLTSVDINVELMAQQAVDHLVKVEQAPGMPFVKTCLSPTLHVRASTGG